MITYILLSIGCWLALGLIIYSVKVFIYCRGPKHYMDLNIMILKMGNNPICHKIMDHRQKVGDGAFVIGAFLIAMILGPFIIVDFIRFTMLLNKCWKIQEKNGG